MIVADTTPGSHWYGDFCRANGIPFAAETYRASSLSQHRLVYFMRPQGSDQLDVAVRELVVDSAGEANGTLCFCCVREATPPEKIDAKRWAAAVYLKSAPLDDVMWEWQGCPAGLEEVERLARGLAEEAGVETITAESDAEVMLLLGRGQR